jgi:hypothetical protein
MSALYNQPAVAGSDGIRNVWAHNARQEFAKISSMMGMYPCIAFVLL